MISNNAVAMMQCDMLTSNNDTNELVTLTNDILSVLNSDDMPTLEPVTPATENHIESFITGFKQLIKLHEALEYAKQLDSNFQRKQELYGAMYMD
ncbi:hypothetical protein [Pantoea cypripedii]|uniref:Uncharacterized protein n=1 Tax=Pantoea cypripedii TaxID=55209 RepID=A0A6B9G5U5_PANCY|nr:hypothetical protein [Pantoea cypripedii]QGY32182.1 hypothetical protein CUN67_24630 [Pantoea cypripedii]